MVLSGYAADPFAVPTFHAIGLYWKPVDGSGIPVGSTTNTCSVEYRVVGTSTWLNARPLWFDDIGTKPAGKDTARVSEYRGSIVDLMPGTDYEIRLTLASGPSSPVTLTSSTMDEDLPETSPVMLGGASPSTNVSALIIPPEGGGTAGNYQVYSGVGQNPSGGNAVYQMTFATPNVACVVIDASYVIIRGLKVIGGKHGIEIKPGRTNVIIEDCDISGWGTFIAMPSNYGGKSALGTDGESGIYSRSNELEHVIIQRNRIHDPRTRSNSWHSIYRLGLKGGPPGLLGHPAGPQGIKLVSVDGEGTAGHHIIRYNEIWSSDGVGDVDHPNAGHGFNDGIGGVKNKSLRGFPGKDSDVYGNYIANAWDDAFEIEGGGSNIRVWGNYAERTFIGMGYAGNSLGPLYAFRNVLGFVRYDPFSTADLSVDVSIRPRAVDRVYQFPYEYVTAYPDGNGGGFFKMGDAGNFALGRMDLIHNTSLQPLYQPLSGGALRRAGANSGVATSGGDVRNLYTRNNLLEVRMPDLTPNPNPIPGAVDFSMNIRETSQAFVDLDRDMMNGAVAAAADDEQHRIHAAPTYNGSSPSALVPELASGTPGRDAAMPLENFQSIASGAPDVGAVEAGKGAMRFGIHADWTAFLSSSWSNSAPAITTATIPAATAGQSYQAGSGVQLASSGGDGSLTWALMADGLGDPKRALPSGMTLSASGFLSGTPANPGIYTLTLRVTDSNGDFAATEYLLFVHPPADELGEVFAPAFVVTNYSVAYTNQIEVPYHSASGGKIKVALHTAGGTQLGGEESIDVASGPGRALVFFDSTGLPTGTDHKWHVRLTDSSGSTTLDTVEVTGIHAVANSQPQISTASGALPGASLNTAYSFSLGSSGGDPTNGSTVEYTWTISSGSLPPKFNLSPTTGVISYPAVTDNLTDPGTYFFTVLLRDQDLVTDIGQDEDVKTYFIEIAGSASAPDVTTTKLPIAAAGFPYAATLAAKDGDEPLDWEIINGSLPAGLAQTSTGSATITGSTSAAPGTYTFDLRVTDNDNQQDTQTGVTLDVQTNSIPAFTSGGTLPGATLNSSYTTSIGTSGGNLPTGGSRAVSVAAGGLPLGLTLNSSGTISGTPTALGTSNFTLKVADGDGYNDPADESAQTFSLTVSNSDTSPVILTGSVPDGVNGTAYTATFTASDGNAPLAWSWTAATGSSLPPGLTLSSSGAVSGTPTAAGLYEAEVTVTDSDSDSDTATVVFTIYPALDTVEAGAIIAYPTTVTKGGSIASGDFMVLYNCSSAHTVFRIFLRMGGTAQDSQNITITPGMGVLNISGSQLLDASAVTTGTADHNWRVRLNDSDPSRTIHLNSITVN